MPFAKDAKNYNNTLLNWTAKATNTVINTGTEQSSFIQEAKKLYDSGKYTNSKLAVEKYNSPFQTTRKYRITRITPHCVVGQHSIEQLKADFPPTRKDKASCNYAIAKDGKVLLIVEEDKKANTSSSSDNDHRAVTIECASDASHPYAFNNQVYNTLVHLCADICRRNGKTKLIWFGDKNKALSYQPQWNEMVLTVHRWFKQKACPGDWLMARMDKLASQVNEMIPKIPADGLSTTSGASFDSASDTGYGSTTGGQLYATKNTRIDATVREVCYIDGKGERTLDARSKLNNNLNLSVINYTSFLGSIVGGSTISNGAYGNGDVDTSGITNSNCRAIFDAMLAKGLTAAQCVGILVNIKRESAFNPAAGSKDGYGSIGLCQWTFGRKTAFLNWVGSDWRNDISGQVDFLLHELETSHKSVGDKIRAVTEVSESAAIEVGRLFLWEFEIPAMKYRVQRTNDLPKDVHEIWSQITIQPTSSSMLGGSRAQGKVTTSSGKLLTSGNEIQIPGTLKQMEVSAGIYTWYKRSWARRSNQGKLYYDYWFNSSKPQYYMKYQNQVATLDGYYLVAISQQLGKVGDVITVKLTDGTYFNAIVADAKGTESNSTRYGHVQGGRTNVIEWEMYDPSIQNANTATKVKSLSNSLEKAGLGGKLVASIINYGSWMV